MLVRICDHGEQDVPESKGREGEGERERDSNCYVTPTTEQRKNKRTSAGQVNGMEKERVREGDGRNE